MQEPVGYISRGPDLPTELIAESWLVQHVERLVSAVEGIRDGLDVLAGKAWRETLHEYERAVKERDQQQEAILLLHGSWPVLEAELERANRNIAILERAHPWLLDAQPPIDGDDQDLYHVEDE